MERILLHYKPHKIDDNFLDIKAVRLLFCFRPYHFYLWHSLAGFNALKEQKKSNPISNAFFGLCLSGEIRLRKETRRMRRVRMTAATLQQIPAAKLSHPHHSRLQPPPGEVSTKNVPGAKRHCQSGKKKHRTYISTSQMECWFRWNPDGSTPLQPPSLTTKYSGCPIHNGLIH